MPIAFVVREATLSDVHAIATLLSDLGYPTTPDTMSARLAPILENPEHRTFVVVCNETVAGVIGTRLGRRYEDDRLYGQIMVLIVDARYRRKGLASALMKYTEESLGQQGANAIVVNSGNHREDAHAFYKRMGYRFTGRRYAKTTTPSP